MQSHRIYDEKHDINTDYTRNFFDERAKKLGEMSNPYVSVLLGDQNPAHAENWNKFEKENIFPRLGITKDSAVLDIGCGIGRWAETVIPLAGYYFGADFSSEMIATAKKRCVFEGADYDFYHGSFRDAAEKPAGFYKRKFNCVIVGYVCMYINDSDLEICMRELLKHLDDHCTLYFTETVGVKSRLTLDRCPSAALKTDYDVIYRTPDEYNDSYKALYEAGFKAEVQDLLPHLNNEEGFSETDRWYSILKR